MDSSEPTSAGDSPPRWRLWQMFAVTAYCAVALAFFRPAPLVFLGMFIVPTTIVGYRVAGFLSTSAVVRLCISYVLTVLATLLLGVLLSPFVNRGASERVKQYQQANSLKQVALSLYNYHAVHGTLPDPTSAGAMEPPRSWRVEVLPYIEFESLYEKYDRSEPWNGPSNSRLLNAFSQSGRSGDYWVDSAGRTPIVAVVDDQGRWPEPFRNALAGDRNGTSIDVSKTIVLVALPKPLVPWTEPRDLPPGGLTPELLRVDGWPVRKLLVGFGDGGFEFLSIDEVRTLAPALFPTTTEPSG